jgi:ElaB/YqjD/DUF883 family membrane-anchored ribosome-binding protein
MRFNISNEDSNTYSSITDLDNLKKYIEEVFVSLSNLTDSKLRQMDEKIELLEKQIATLVVGFGEQAVFLEALLAQISFAEEDQQRAFQKNVNDARKEMLKVMQDGSRVVAQQDERLASAIEDVVESKSFDL